MEVVPSAEAETPPPGAGLPLVVSGGHTEAHEPEQDDLPPVSFSKRYRVRPLASTRIFPSLGLLDTPTVVAPVATAGAGEIADDDPGADADVGVAALPPELVAPPPPQPAATTATTTTGMARRRR